MLKQAREALGPGKKVHLVAGVCKQEDIEKFKGKPLLMKVQLFKAKWKDLNWLKLANGLMKLFLDHGLSMKVIRYLLRIFD
jgi:hypothetical protein